MSLDDVKWQHPVNTVASSLCPYNGVIWCFVEWLKGNLFLHSGNSVVLKMFSADPKVSTATSQGIRGYISVMASFVFTVLIEGLSVKK